MLSVANRAEIYRVQSLIAAPVPADAEQHRGGAQLDHHLPHAHEHHGPLHEELTTVSR